jgi:hypothetical protein
MLTITGQWRQQQQQQQQQQQRHTPALQIAVLTNFGTL